MFFIINFMGDFMNDYHETQLNKHMYQLDRESAKEEEIQLLAEQLVATSLSAIGSVARASKYDFDYTVLMNATNGSEEFNEMFYSVAKKLIDSVG
jgi:hypothetical protein